MVNELEKLIVQTEVPEMEVAPDRKPKKKGAKRQSVTLDELPEVILPKTKAEVYREAKGRLTQKSRAASKTNRTKSPEREAAATRLARPEDELYEPCAPSAQPTWVGSEAELIPFAWRMPLVDLPKPSKFYSKIVRIERDLLLPVPNDR